MLFSTGLVYCIYSRSPNYFFCISLDNQILVCPRSFRFVGGNPSPPAKTSGTCIATGNITAVCARGSCYCGSISTSFLSYSYLWLIFLPFWRIHSPPCITTFPAPPTADKASNVRCLFSLKHKKCDQESDRLPSQPCLGRDKHAPPPPSAWDGVSPRNLVNAKTMARIESGSNTGRTRYSYLATAVHIHGQKTKKSTTKIKPPSAK